MPTTATAPEPTIESIFTRVETPTGAVSETIATSTLWAAAPPTGSLPWAGFGATTWSSQSPGGPIVWSLPEPGASRAPTFELLPIPAAATTGSAFHAASTFGGQLSGGHVVVDGAARAAFWYRDEKNNWEVDTSIADLIAPDRQSWIWNVAGSETWALIRVGVESATETASTGSPLSRNHLVIAQQSGRWQELELPDTDLQSWNARIFINGDHGLITGSPDRQTVFTTDDAGASWRSHSVGLIDGQGVFVIDAFWDDDRWFSVGQRGSQGTATITVDADGTWRPQFAAISVTGLGSIGITGFQAVRRLKDGTLLAIVDTVHGSSTFTSPDGATWFIDHALGLNSRDSDPDSTVRFVGFVTSPSDESTLAIRRFAAPVWLADDGVQAVDNSLFETNDIKEVLHRDDGFVAITGTLINERTGIELWTSSDGIDWELSNADPDLRLTDVDHAGDTILGYGINDQNQQWLKVYGEQDVSINLIDAIDVADYTLPNPPRTGPAAGRNLVTITLQTTGDRFTRFAFVDLSDQGPVDGFAVPAAANGVVSAVCPQLPSGVIPVIIGDKEGLGSVIEVWADQAEPRIGAGRLVDTTYGLANVLIRDCELFGSGLAAIGTACPVDITDFLKMTRECTPRVWTSEDGLIWAEHPGSEVFETAGLFLPQLIEATGTGALLTGVNDTGSQTMLWSITPGGVEHVPGAFPSGVTIRYLAASDDTVLAASPTEIFAARLGEVMDAIAKAN